MTVWIQNPFDNLPLEGYRPQRYWLIAEALAAAGHRVIYFTSDFSHAHKARRRLDPTAKRPFELVFLATLPYRRNVSLQRIRSHRAYAAEWQRMATHFARPELIVTSIPSVSGAAMAIRLARHFGAKVVVDVMDAWPETFERLAPPAIRWLFKLLLLPIRQRVRRIYREADLVTGVAERYRKLTGRKDFFLAYHGIAAEPTLAPWSSASRPIRLVYAGNTGTTYDLATLARAVMDNEDFTLDIAGSADGKLDFDCPRIRLHGYLSAERLKKLLGECDLGVVPMREDSWVGVPYKLADYAAAGLKVVSSLGGESAKLLRQYAAGEIYEYGNSKSLAAAVRRAIELAPEGPARLCRENLLASKIYPEYVRRLEKLKK